MTSKNINTPKLLVLLIGILFALVPGVLEGHAANSEKNDNNPTGAVTYNVIPAEDSSSSTGEPRVPSLTVGTLKQGQSYASYLNIGSGVKWLEVDLKWSTTSNSLGLTIYNPSGTSLGTFYDNSDGKKDARIHLSIYPSSVNLAQGRWIFTTKGVTVSGTTGQKYTLYFYTH